MTSSARAQVPPEASLELIARALDSVAEAVIITDHASMVVYWNAAAEALYGFSATEARGQHLDELVLPIQVGSLTGDVLAQVDDGHAYVGEWLMQHRSGRRFPASVSTSAIFDSAGKPRHYIGISRDVTLQKEAFRTAQTLASIVANSADGILSMDTRGVVTWANDKIQEILGWAPDQLVGNPASVLVPEERRGKQQSLMAQILTGERIPPLVVNLRRRDGSAIEVSIALGVVRDEAGNVSGTSCVIRDLTVENELRRDVEREAERLRARFEQGSTPQTLMDMDGNFVSVNDAYCALVGWSRDDLLHKPVASMAHVSDSGAGTAANDLLRSGRQKSTTFEKLVRHRDGGAIPVLIDMTVLNDDAGFPCAMASFVRDLTAVPTEENRLAKQQALFHALNRRASDVSVVYDADMNVLYVSPSVAGIFGYWADEPVGVPGRDFIHPDDLSIFRPALERVLASPNGFERVTVRLKDGAGEWRWVEESLSNCLEDPDIRGLVGNLRDVTTEVRAQEELRRSEARYRAIAETAHEGIVVLEPSGTVLFANQKLADLLGHSLDELGGGQVASLFDSDAAIVLEHKLQNRAALGPETFEMAYPHPDGTEHTLSLSIAPLPLTDSGEVGSLAMVSDVTEERRAETELRRRAVHDELTDLPNRALLTDRIEMALKRQGRAPGESSALLFLDLDRFKLVNDSHGHDAGDVLLIEIGRRLQDAVRPTDTVARLGGDEFAVLCEGADEMLAVAIANRVRECLGDPVELGGQRIYVDASIGIAVSPPHGAETLLRYADLAMYEAKSAGRGQIRVFDAKLATSVDRGLLVMNALREALFDDALDLHYQPVVDIRTGQLLGVEALLRWTDARLGSVSSVEIVAAAESMGLSLALDRWVLDRSCTELAGLRRHGALASAARLSVNVSARSFATGGLDHLVARTLTETGWPADQLTIEVTESAIMTDAPHAVDLLTKLRDQGVAIAIDDFGTGYSSLAYLKRLPVSILKIDVSFVDQVTVDADSRAIARSIVDLANAVGLQTIAEGIETAEQAEVMLELGCPSGQGFLWSAAVPAADLGRFSTFRREAVPLGPERH